MSESAPRPLLAIIVKSGFVFILCEIPTRNRGTLAGYEFFDLLFGLLPGMAVKIKIDQPAETG